MAEASKGAQDAVWAQLIGPMYFNGFLRNLPPHFALCAVQPPPHSLCEHAQNPFVSKHESAVFLPSSKGHVLRFTRKQVQEDDCSFSDTRKYHIGFTEVCRAPFPHCAKGVSVFTRLPKMHATQNSHNAFCLTLHRLAWLKLSSFTFIEPSSQKRCLQQVAILRISQ